MSVASENILFAWRISMIDANARAIEADTRLFDHLGNWDTALEKLDLRLAAKRLRESADRLDNIERQIRGPDTSFPDDVDLRRLEAAE